MDNQQSVQKTPAPHPRDETAAQAFTRLDDRVASLDGRIALMARGVEQMAAERSSIDIPDYNPTLEQTNTHLVEITERLNAIERAPALGMTPEAMGARIAAAAQEAREADRANVQQVQQSQADAVQVLDRIIGNARARDTQRQHLLWGIGGGILAGCLLWSFLPGMIARAMPESWHWPERLAARMVGEPSFWDAGIHMMQAGSPEAWRAITAAAMMRYENKEAIAACERDAAKRKKTVRCIIKLGSSA